jgi:hypothetical protein
MYIFLIPFFLGLFLFQLKKEKYIDFWKNLTCSILDIEDNEDEFEKEKEKQKELEKELENELEKQKELEKVMETKYEEKYWDKLSLLDNHFIFTEEEQETKTKFFNAEKEKIQTNIVYLKKKIYYFYNEINKISLQEFQDGDNEDFDLQEFQEDTINQIQNLEKELEDWKKKEKEEEILNENAEKNVIELRLEKLKKCFVMEKTPLGNVIMYYNAKRETFEYYSDSTIPYRFLEVVARKYVITFHCRPLYIIMEDELKKYEKKLELQKDKQILYQKEHPSSSNKKPIFAKFKSYNKEAGSGRVNKVPPPKNSIPNKKTTNSNQPNENIILKENSNRYTNQGRFSNFFPLQKMERKLEKKKHY